MGAPKGPRLPPEQHTDEEGVFTVFPGVACRTCALPLTSRNRYRKTLFCVPHGREMDYAKRHPLGWIRPLASSRLDQPITRSMPTTSKPACESSQIPRSDFQSPQYRRLQSLFTAFMNHPTLDDSSALLVSAMNEYELMARLRRVIPA